MTDLTRTLDLFADTDQIAEMVEAHRAANNPDTQLAALQQAASAVADPTVQADLIVDALNFLHENDETQSVVLDDIHQAASALVANVQQLDANLKAAVALAQTLRAQREDNRKALDSLRTAIADRDADHPAIEMLIEDLEEELRETIEFDIWDFAWDTVTERIFEETPLHYNQASRLLAILTEGELSGDSPLWHEISEWINFVDRELGHGEGD